ncbi:exosome complex RNA-binding protein Csl4 [Cryobacterium sp. MP_M5]|nr:exosome complex RNA-binding protein Csl4 [Cryobacterium sp. MP_M5]
MVYTRVESSTAVQKLAIGLHDCARDRPWVVVSSPFGTSVPEIGIDQLSTQIGDVAKVFLIETGELTRQLGDLLPPQFQVYGSAGRSYPIGPDAFADLSRSRLRFTHGDPQHATDQLVTDALAHAHQAGLFALAPASVITVTGTVKGFLLGGSRALVELDDGGMATVWQELTYPPVPLDWTLVPGQRVQGALDAPTHRLNVEVKPPTNAAIAQRFPNGSITLALVQKVSAQRAVLALHPHLSFTITRADISPNPLDKVDALLSEGDVVAARVIHLPSGALHLCLSDVDDDEPVLPPLSAVRNGPPWLRENRPLLPVVEDDEHADEPVLEPASAQSPVEYARAQAASELAETSQAELVALAAMAHLDESFRPPRPSPGPGRSHAVRHPTAPAIPFRVAPMPAPPVHPHSALQSTQLSLAEAKARITRLEAQLVEAGATDSDLAKLREQARSAQLQLRDALVELGTLRHTVAELRDEQRTQKRMLRESRRTVAAPPASSEYETRRAQWEDASGWVRHEILLAWVDRVPESDREEWPLPHSYVLSDRFADSLSGLDDGQLAKAFKASVDVLTGRVKTLTGRHLHALRQGAGAADPHLLRWDGARCMRVSIEQNTPAARRMHFWQKPDGGIELIRIVTHDDMEA